MSVVLRELVRRLELRAADARPERDRAPGDHARARARRRAGGRAAGRLGAGRTDARGRMTPEVVAADELLTG